MIRLLALLFTGHTHKWEVIKTFPMKRRIGSNYPEYDVVTIYHRKCDKCGALDDVVLRGAE